MQKGNCKRNKSNQGHIIRNKHAEKKANANQIKNQKPRFFHTGNNFQRQKSKSSVQRKSLHHSHQRKQNRKRAKINSPQNFFSTRFKNNCRNHRQQNRNHKNNLLLKKILQPHKKIFHHLPSQNSSRLSQQKRKGK